MNTPIDKKFWETKHSIEEKWWLTGTSIKSLLDLHNLQELDLKDKKILEIGVGLGTCTKELRKYTENLECCDISEIGLDRVKQYAKHTYLTTDLKNGRAVDVAICHLVFQHCTDQEITRIINDVNLTKNGIFTFQFATLKDNIILEETQHLMDFGSHFFRSVDKIKEIVNNSNKKIVSIETPKFWKKIQHEWNFIKVKNKE
jgi:predicted TPR repeat methyltransferase